MIDDDELLHEFLIESFENLDRLDQDFLDLEREPGSREILASIFRTVHTIKGTSGFLGFHGLEALTHVGETLLGKLRDGLLTADATITGTLLEMVDAVREILGEIERTGAEGPQDHSGLVARLTVLAQGGTLDAALDPAGVPPLPPVVVPEIIAGRLGGLLVDAGLCTVEAVLDALRAQEQGDDRRLGEILVDRGVLSVNQVLEVLGEQQVRHEEQMQKAVARVTRVGPVEPPVPRPSGDSDSGGRSVAESSVRVDVSLLDGLIDLVGELVLARNQLVQLTGTSGGKGDATGAAAQRVSLITSELQERMMKTRMQPIHAVWGKLPRVVRDLAVACGKQVRVEMEGQDVELDRTIIEAIKDPLTHVVRNSVDHGIEPPQVRLGRGKPVEGRLSLRAYHEGGKVVIEVADDGGGIDPAKVKAKAVEKGLVTAAQAEAMGDQEAIGLVFAPGFSTAEQVTNVSGRGVGMDVVKTNIERIGGSLDVHSRPGRGTTLVIRIPLTLAIVPALVVTCSGGRYAIPQTNLVELVRLKCDTQPVETIDGSWFYRLRGDLLPVLDLAALLAPEAAAGAGASEQCAQATRSLVVLQVDGRQFGLLVDRVNDAEEIVVKPLGRHLKGTPLFAGCTIMGDGAVALILDVMALAERARIGRTPLDRGDDRDLGDAADDREALLLCDVGGGRVALPLTRVARLEKVDVAAVGWAGAQEVAKYRGRLLPIVRLSSLVGDGRGAEASDSLLVVVTSEHDGRSVGMVVDRIVETADVDRSSIALQGGAGRCGVLGTAVLRDQVTDVVDVDGIVATVDDSFFSPASLPPATFPSPASPEVRDAPDAGAVAAA